MSPHFSLMSIKLVEKNGKKVIDYPAKIPTNLDDEEEEIDLGYEEEVPELPYKQPKTMEQLTINMLTLQNWTKDQVIHEFRIFNDRFNEKYLKEKEKRDKIRQEAEKYKINGKDFVTFVKDFQKRINELLEIGKKLTED